MNVASALRDGFAVLSSTNQLQAGGGEPKRPPLVLSLEHFRSFVRSFVSFVPSRFCWVSLGSLASARCVSVAPDLFVRHLYRTKLAAMQQHTFMCHFSGTPPILLTHRRFRYNERSRMNAIN